ncbi:MAG TPA: hypothetical protein VG318_18120 [Actinomycetota bacterium]|nr:hypothetical protein [Actinomycetota bacterium]
MSTGKLAIAVLALSLAVGGGIAALADTNDDRSIGVIELEDGVLRKDDSADEVAGVDEGDDADRTRGDDGTDGGNNTGDGDGTNGDDGTGGGHNTGDVTYDAPAGTATGGGDTT